MGENRTRDSCKRECEREREREIDSLSSFYIHDVSFSLFPFDRRQDRRRSGTESKTAREKEGGSKKELPVKARLGGTIILFSRHIFLFFSFLVRFRQDGGDFPQIF